MQKILASGIGSFFIKDEQSGEFVPVGEISDVEIEDVESDGSDDVVVQFFSNKEYECEMTIEQSEKLRKELEQLNKSLKELNDDSNRPNPVFVPKHIARRRKW